MFFSPDFFSRRIFQMELMLAGNQQLGGAPGQPVTFRQAKKNRLSRGGFSASSGSGGLLSSQGASTIYEFTSGSCCLQTQTD